MNGQDAPLLDKWRQGDLALVPLELPVMTIGLEEIEWKAINAVHGVVVLSQSCDIIKSPEHRPYVQVAGLVPATDGEIAKAIRRELPSRIHLDCLNEKGLLIDLDAAATVHKSVVATWPRTAGCRSDDEQRRVSAGLARHRQRFAFPDLFIEMLRPIRKWIESKRSSTSDQGNFIRSMHEIRVYCDKWDAPTSLTFLIVVNHIPDKTQFSKWLEFTKLFETKMTQDVYPHGEFRIVTYDDISAREYLESDRLDWDGLSDVP